MCQSYITKSFLDMTVSDLRQGHITLLYKPPILKVHAGNLDKNGEKNKSFQNIYIFGFSRPC